MTQNPKNIINQPLEEKFLTHIQGALDLSPACIIIADAPEGNIIYINKAVVKFRELPGEKISSVNMYEYISVWKEFSKDGTQLANEDMPLAKALQGEVTQNLEIIVELDDGRRKWALASAAPIYSDANKIIGGSVIWYDISQQKEIEYNLQQQVDFDGLTSAYSRQKLFDLAERLFTRSRFKKINVTCFSIDIDHFKYINDTFGHAAGDEVLVALSKRISSLIRPSDIFGRVGGEEFLIFIPNMPEETVKKQAEKIRENIAALRFKFDDTEHKITTSIGVASNNSKNQVSSLSELIAQSDKALYAAKNSGRNNVQYYKPH